MPPNMKNIYAYFYHYIKMIINNGRVRAFVAQKIWAGTGWCCDSSSCDLIKSLWQDKRRFPGQYTLALVLNKSTLPIQKLLILPHGRKDSVSGVYVRHSQGLWHWQFVALLVRTGTFAASSSWPLIQVTMLSIYKTHSCFPTGMQYSLSSEAWCCIMLLCLVWTLIFIGTNDFISVMDESQVLKIELQFTEHGLAKDTIFMSSVIVRKSTNLHLNNVMGHITQHCVVLPPLLSPAWILFPWFSY